MLLISGVVRSATVKQFILRKDIVNNQDSSPSDPRKVPGEFIAQNKNSVQMSLISKSTGFSSRYVD